MAKSVTKKSTNRKLKRSIRRTLGALCMTTSIIVAAIPFPDAAADDGAIAQMNASVKANVIPYSYDTDNYNNCSPSKLEDITISGVNLNQTYQKTGTAYTVSKPSSGNWQLDWQFEYYSESNGADGLITKYNNQYQVDEIALNYRVYSNYINIPESQVSGYYSATDTEKTAITVYAGSAVKIPSKDIYNLGHVYILEGDPVTCADHDFFYDFFREEYDQYYADYKAYTEHLGTEEEKDYPLPEVIKKTYKDVYPSDADQVQFFCDQVFGKGTDMYLQIVDQRAYAADGTPTGWEKVYIPRVNEMPNDTDTITIGGTPYYVDTNGFLADKFASLIGIAKEAFKGVSNVKTLEMAREISFIGDSAFEDSFLQSVRLSMDAKIGNRAFKNCNRLTSVTMPSGVQQIGTEAFAGTSITSIDIPDTVTLVGGGAFYNCGQLQTVVFSGTNSANKEIRNFAFYDCLALNSVDFGTARVNKIGDCAFAVSKVVTGNLTEFKFPDYIETGDNIGKYLFGARTNLKNVTMPKNLGTSTNSTLPVTMFYNCVNLENVTFPDTCYSVSYTPDLFKDVITQSFYVRGPKVTNNGATAEPRKSTWVAYFNGDAKQQVPYVYSENGEDFYEISDGVYITVIDGVGMLVSCEFVGAPGQIDTFTIPSTVGSTTVTGIEQGCLGTSDNINDVLGYIENLVVEDGSAITTIANDVFNGAKSLKTIYLGDSVTTIGNNSFSVCNELESVSIGSGITSIGESAFENCPKLTEISFANPIGGPDSFPVSNIGNNAFSTGGAELTIYGCINGVYGPFAWAMQPSNYMDQSKGVRVCYRSPKEDPQRMVVILDNSNNLPTLIDYPKYTDDEIQEILEDVSDMTPSEAALLDAAINIVIPDGVKSIDTKGYFSSNSKIVGGGAKPIYTSNATNIATYFSKEELENGDGLFCSPSNLSGLLDEYIDDSEEQLLYETDDKGNDRIETVTLTSVEYLPDLCFNSCEKLQVVNLGASILEVGDMPFKECFNLTSIACGNDNFSCNNGILYENLEDGSKRLVECLAGRGNIVGSKTISLANDPDLANVSEIAIGAFSYCPYITVADFTGANNFTEIPEECFYGSFMLNEVDLPENVRVIGDRAFGETGEYTKAIVRGREVSLGDDAYYNVKQPYLVSYRDSSVREAARKQGVNVEETLDEMCTVKFYMPDGSTLIKTITIEVNGDARRISPSDEEMEPYLTEGYKLYGWNGVEDIKCITQDCFFIAIIGLEDGEDTDGDGIPDKPFEDDDNGGSDNGDGSNDGNGNGNGNSGGGNGNGSNSGSGGNGNGNDSGSDDDSDSGNGSGNGSGDGTTDPTKKYTLTVVYGDGSGVYAPGSTVIISAISAPAGKEFYKWTTNNSGVTITSATSAATTVKTTNSDATITATYRDKSSVSSNSVNRKPIGSSGTSVQISKPGISNTDKAYASVSGSTDNFIVKITESQAAANAVATALANEYADMSPIKYFAMDISLYDKNGNLVTNTNGLSVNVTMPIPDALVQYGGNNKVGAVVNGNTLEKLNCKFTTVSGIPCVTFTATHFSPYTIYVDTSNLSINTLDSTPKTGDGIHPKWFFSVGLACIAILLFMKKDKAVPRKTVVS